MFCKVEHRFHDVAFGLGDPLLHIRHHDLLVEFVELPLAGITGDGENTFESGGGWPNGRLIHLINSTFTLHYLSPALQ